MEADSRRNDFIVNSKGHCFFCLNKISQKLAPTRWAADQSQKESSSTTSSLQTVQCLSRYLKMDITKVFQEKGSIPPSLLAKVEQSRLKVDLCEECTRLTNSFSVLYRQLEKLKFEMNSNLIQIQKSMQRAEELGRTEELRRLDKSGEDEGLIKILDVLRKEAIEKCSSRSTNLAPKVKIQNLTRKEANALVRTRKNVSEANAATDSNAELNCKVESQIEDFNGGDDSGAGYFDDVNSNNSDCNSSKSDPGMPNKSIDTGMEAEASKRSSYLDKKPRITVTQSTSKTGTDTQNYFIDPQTGKYKCSLCSMEFGSNPGFHDHFRTVHLKIRYKCNLCEKVFTQKSTYNVHLRSVHLGVRYKCLVCNKQFTQKTHLTIHQRQNVCKSQSPS